MRGGSSVGNRSGPAQEQARRGARPHHDVYGGRGEGTPPEVDIALLEQRLLDIPSATAVDDLHVWTITSGFDAMSCHLVVADMAQARMTLLSAQEAMKSFGLTNVTIQVEDQSLREAEGELRL